MRFLCKPIPALLTAGAALLGLLSVPVATGEQTASGFEQARVVDAEFRGCESASLCRFWIEAPEPLAPSLVRVWPDGVTRIAGIDPVALALRDRLNALLSNMIHQAKHIVLHDLRRLGNGTFSAVVTVNGADLAADPVVVELGVHAGVSNR